MNAVEIIDEIKHLPPAEQARVVQFVRSLDADARWTPGHLAEAAERLTREEDPAEAEALKERIAAGFYGESRA